MSFTITVPDNYGYVVLSSVIGHFGANMVLSGRVMGARKKFNVQYPNLYAVPGYHKDADAFNRVQRGHQNVLEGMPLFLCMGLVVGLKHPITSIVLNVVHCIGCVLYQVGYADTTLDAKTARFKKGGPLKPIAELGILVASIKVIGNWNKWW